MRKKKNFPIDADNFDKVFTHDHLYHSFKKCVLGVGWKSSVQKYKAFAIENIHKAYEQIHAGTYMKEVRPDGFVLSRLKNESFRDV